MAYSEKVLINLTGIGLSQGTQPYFPNAHTNKSRAQELPSATFTPLPTVCTTFITFYVGARMRCWAVFPLGTKAITRNFHSKHRNNAAKYNFTLG